MSLSPYDAKYFAHDLKHRYHLDNGEKLSGILVDAKDEIDRQREWLIVRIEAKLDQHTSLRELFSFCWRKT